MTYSLDQDVKDALGTLGNRLPAWVTIATFRNVANAEIVDRLSRVYPDGVPAFEGVALEVVKYAEAKLAAAEILEGIRVNLPELGDAPDRLRASVALSIDDGVVGYPAGSTTTTPGGTGGTPATSTPGPRVSSFTPLSAFPDPYEDGRFGARFE